MTTIIVVGLITLGFIWFHIMSQIQQFQEARFKADNERMVKIINEHNTVILLQELDNYYDPYTKLIR